MKRSVLKVRDSLALRSGLRQSLDWRNLTAFVFKIGKDPVMRTYLAVADGTEEAEIAVRFAARRAAKTGGALAILAIVEPQEFVAFGSIQATIEAEAEERAQDVAARALDMLDEERGVLPRIVVKHGEPVAAIQQALSDNPEIGALVLGAAKTGAPGPLVSYFAGAGMSALPCPLMIIPGSLSREALDRLS